ncbi:MAG: hypothetical protein PHD40_06010, partial [Syntrophomonadaceae bacterium]|nr:hypothetical protein [Syntrophomonadaceae bacterium]
MTAELLPAFVAPKPLVKLPKQADNQPLSKPAFSKNTKFADCVKKKIDREALLEAKANKTAQPKPGLINNRTNQQESPDESEAEKQAMQPESEVVVPELFVMTATQDQDMPTLMAGNAEAESFINETASNTVTAQTSAMLEANPQPADKLLTGLAQPVNPEPVKNISPAELAVKELINQTNSTLSPEQILAEAKPTAIQMEGQNQKQGMQINNLSNANLKEQIPVQLLVDERPAAQEKQLTNQQVDVKKLIQMENHRNLSQRVVAVTSQSQTFTQGEGSGRPPDAEIINLLGQVAADTNLTSRGNSLENTNLSTLTAKSDG